MMDDKILDGEDTGHVPFDRHKKSKSDSGTDLDDRLPGLPRYVRINTLKKSVNACHKEAAAAGYQFCKEPNPAGNRSYFRDDLVPDLMVFKPKGKSDISRLPLVAAGEMVIQQKASCFPALALHPPPGSVVIDGCAAPGNKTCHLAALMQNSGHIFAFERDERRCDLLRRMMELKGASIVTPCHASFMDTDPTDPKWAGVTHILLDPSCSSSGMSKHPERDPAALRELADRQEEMILHAMRFPALQELSYSTCSVHEIENEEVVLAVMRAQQRAQQGQQGQQGQPRPGAKAGGKAGKKQKQRAPAHRFTLERALPAWPRRGHALPSVAATEPQLAQLIATCCVRTAYPDDATIGFFLAKFVREGAPPAKPCAELQLKLDTLERARAKLARHATHHAPPTKPSAAREVPAWRLERDAKLKAKKQRKE